MSPTHNPPTYRNPFRKTPMPLKPSDAKTGWIYSKNVWDRLEECVQKRENAVVLGVKGSGKSTLLNMFFSADFCAASAKSNTLVFFADLSDTTNGEGLCKLLIKQLCSAAEKDLPQDAYAALLQALEDAKNDNETLKRTFILACERLHAKNYTLLLVMDAFEQFVSSPEITLDQHNMLRSLLEKDIMRSIVATNYDLEKSSLPLDVQDSIYLQKFQEKITMEGFSLEEATDFIAKKLPTDDPVQMSPKQIKFLHNLTGGIPWLFELGANFIYDVLKEKKRPVAGDIERKLYDQARSTMKGWFKFFTQEYNDTLQAVLTSMPAENSLQQFSISLEDQHAYTTAARLKERGFWVDGTRSGKCTFNCLLLQKYAAQEYRPVTTEALSESAPKRYNVFISYKRTDNGNDTEDKRIALDLYNAFRHADGLVPFLDIKEIPKAKTNNFNDIIMDALETTQAFVYVCTNAHYITESSYIQWECNNYIGELASGRKPAGSIYGVLDHVRPDLIARLPMKLRATVDFYADSQEDIQRLVNKVRSQLLG